MNYFLIIICDNFIGEINLYQRGTSCFKNGQEIYVRNAKVSSYNNDWQYAIDDLTEVKIFDGKRYGFIQLFFE